MPVAVDEGALHTFPRSGRGRCLRHAGGVWHRNIGSTVWVQRTPKVQLEVALIFKIKVSIKEIQVRILSAKRDSEKRTPSNQGRDASEQAPNES